MPERVAVLVAKDNGACLTQARFTRIAKKQVKVLAAIGHTQYVDRIVPLAEARRMWRDLRKQGWVQPTRTPILTTDELRGVIYG